MEKQLGRKYDRVSRQPHISTKKADLYNLGTGTCECHISSVLRAIISARCSRILELGFRGRKSGSRSVVKIRMVAEISVESDFLCGSKALCEVTVLIVSDSL